jgi:hypothetical protein
MQLDISQVDLSGALQFGSDGYVEGIARPAYNSIINSVLEKNEDPWGPSGKQMVLAFVAADRKSIYREVKIFGMGCWMGVVNDLLQAGLIDLLDGHENRRFAALFAPSDEIIQHLEQANGSSSSKYDPLILHLAKHGGEYLTLTFMEIEELLGELLPASARSHLAWWANTKSDPTHSWANRWTAAGWHARADLPHGRVTFSRHDSGGASATRLSELLPTGREAVMDLVKRAGIDVSAWHFTADGRAVDNPRANPSFCYDWSFGSPEERYVVCLWHGNLEEGGDWIVSNCGAGGHRKLLEQLRDVRGIDGRQRSRLIQQIRRAREFEEALEQSWRRNLPLRVIINAGGQRLPEEIADRASNVELRALDDQPWYIHSHHPDEGRWLLVRSVPFGARDGEDDQPEDDDGSPGADDVRRMGTIKIRRGQAEFRASLIGAYAGRCAVTGSRIVDLLEAAHILPHAEGTNYRASNGLLLRADIHTLYDLHLLSIDERYRVQLSKALETSEYRRYHGSDLLALPGTMEQQPSADNLRVRHHRFLTKEAAR